MEAEQKQSLLRLRDSYLYKEDVNRHMNEIFDAYNIQPGLGEEDFWNKAEDLDKIDKRAGDLMYKLATLWESVPYKGEKVAE